MAFPELFGYIQQNKYIYSLIILIVFYIISELIVIISRKIILKLTRKTKTEIDDLIVKRTNKPISLILLLVGLRLTLQPLGIKAGILDIAEKILLSLIIIIIIYIIITLIDIFIDNWGKKVAEKTKSALDESIIPLLHRFSRIFISIVGLMFILPVFGIQIGPLLTSLGIAGIAIAFALQNTLGNVFGGMSLILDKSIKVGDTIKLENGIIGTITDVGLRSTKLQTLDGELITLPNGKLADSQILNFMLPSTKLRISIDFGVSYGTDTKKVNDVVLNVLSSIPDVLKEPSPKIMMLEMGDFSLKFRALFWVSHFDKKVDVKTIATDKIYNALIKSKITIPYPTKTVYIKKE